MIRGAALLSTSSRIAYRTSARTSCSSLLKRSLTTSTEQESKKSGSSIGKKIVWLTTIGAGTYAGATYLALNNEAFHDTYTSYVPGGEHILDILEDASNDKEFKEYYEKGIAVKQQVQQNASQLSNSAEQWKEALLDWYEYLGEAVAQLTGEKQPASITSSSTTKRSYKNNKNSNFNETPIFDHVMEGGGPARIPTMQTTSGEPIVQDLVNTSKELIKALNTVGLSGHAKRLADFVTRDIKLIEQEFKVMQHEEQLVLEKLQQLNKFGTELDQKVTDHYQDMVDKITKAQTQAKERINEKAIKLRDSLIQENNKVQQQLIALGERELQQQRDKTIKQIEQDLEAQLAQLQQQFKEKILQKVEQERGGRLANIEQVVALQQELETLSHANAEYLDDSRKAHQLLIAMDALKRAAYAGNKQAFLDELQALRKMSRPDTPFANQVEKRNDALIQIVATTISETVAQHGIHSFTQLADRFEKVATEVRDASLIPEGENGSMVSHIISIILSKFLFPKHGLVEGDDIEARLARAKYYLHHDHDLESATREINQLKGWPKHLAADWLDAARRHLEIKQALEVMRTQAILNSLLQLE
ncbi:mitochondrial inner membrane protein-domain-containing protein [Cunninghamella echinulata]|nr:mitochondrial inner membrane protein-domain-containing protein [Cunninghamella echinulata]